MNRRDVYDEILNKIQLSDEYITNVVLLDSKGLVLGSTEGSGVDIDYHGEETVEKVLSGETDAAQSGVIDAGSGFAVVAEQIGILAKQSTEPADNISDLVEEIYKAMGTGRVSETELTLFIEGNVIVEKYSL